MIRFGTLADMEPVVALSKEFYHEINLDAVGYRFHEPQIRASYTDGLSRSDGHHVLLYIEHGQILGLFFFRIRDEHYYFTNRRFATEIVWHSDPKLPPKKRLKIMMKLFDAGEMFMESQGCLNIYTGLDARKEHYHYGINKYLLRKGYNEIVTTYHKEVEHVS